MFCCRCQAPPFQSGRAIGRAHARGVRASSEEVCKTVLDKAFPDGGPRTMSAEVSRCCSVSIWRTEFGNRHENDCCRDAQPGSDLERACSPWGPPVPPSMSWREMA